MSEHVMSWLPRAAAVAGDAGWIVQCDFDGTISTEDVTDSLLQRFGRDGWVALEEAWERGDIGSRACMQGQVAMLDMSEDELMAHLDGVSIDPHFAEFVRVAQAHGMQVQVVSDGLDRAIRHVLQRHGLGALPVFANHLLQVGPRQWQLQNPHAKADCKRASGNCKCARAGEQQAQQRQVLYVGDGSSDFCVSARADMVLAKDSLIGHCVHHGIGHHPFRQFDEATALMLGVTAPLELTA